MAIDNPLAYMGQTGSMPNQFGIDTSGQQDGFLGGVLADQKRAMGQQLFDQMSRGNEMDLAQQALRLQQNKDDEASYLGKQRAIKGEEAGNTLDLWHSGVLKDVAKGKALADLSASELEAVKNHYEAQQKQLDVGRQQASLIDPQTGKVPFGMVDQLQQQRKALGMKPLPDDADEMTQQLQNEQQLALHTGPRLDNAVAATNAAALKKQEEEAQQKRTETEVAGRKEVAQIESMTQKTPDNVMASIIRRYTQPNLQEAKDKHLTASEIAAYQDYLIKQAGPGVEQDLATKLARLRASMANQNQTQDQRNAAWVAAHSAIQGWDRAEAKKQQLLKQEASDEASGTTPDIHDNPQRKTARDAALNSPAAQDAQNYGGPDGRQFLSGQQNKEAAFGGQASPQPSQSAVEIAAKWDKSKVQTSPLDGWNYKYNPATHMWDPISKAKK